MSGACSAPSTAVGDGAMGTQGTAVQNQGARPKESTQMQAGGRREAVERARMGMLAGGSVDPSLPFPLVLRPCP